MSALPKIPSTASHYWREFRHAYLPIVVFLLVLGFSINLWNQHVAPPSIVGEVEAVRSSITATMPGEILDLNVDMLTRVEKGDVIATVSVMDDSTIKATMKVEEADLVVLEERLNQNRLRIQESLESLNHNLAVRRVERASDNVLYQHAVVEFKRSEAQLKDGVVSQSTYDLAKANMESLQEKVGELDRLIKEMVASLDKLRAMASAATNNPGADPIMRAIQAKQEAIQDQFKPMLIRAPMSGVVSAVFKRKGEKVVRGDAIVVISSVEADRIMAFVRQPLNLKPKVGDTVEVRSRSQGRPLAMAKVMKVGTQLEAIGAHILPQAVQNGTMEFGLPLMIKLPPELALMPGEVVDINLPTRN